jgi:hypothetical protein
MADEQIKEQLRAVGAKLQKLSIYLHKQVMNFKIASEA